MFGMFNGVVLSNLQVVSLSSTRNLAIIGTAILFGLMIPYWLETNPDAIQTGKPYMSPTNFTSNVCGLPSKTYLRPVRTNISNTNHAKCGLEIDCPPGTHETTLFILKWALVALALVLNIVL